MAALVRKREKTEVRRGEDRENIGGPDM